MKAQPRIRTGMLAPHEGWTRADVASLFRRIRRFGERPERLTSEAWRTYYVAPYLVQLRKVQS